MRRPDPQLPPVWPERLLQPSRPPRLVYLDLNHWIALAKVDTGHPEGLPFTPVLHWCRAAVAEGSATFPLSDVHYAELSGIKDPAQRSALASVMEELSEFNVLLGRPHIMRLEVEAALDALLGPTPDPFPPTPLISFGFGHAFGINGRLRAYDHNGADVTDVLPPAVRARLEEQERSAQRKMLAGPEDDEVDELQAAGWDPAVARRGAARRAKQEQELIAALDADEKMRRGRLYDVVAAREVAIELSYMLPEDLQRRGRSLPEALPTRDAARRFASAMPSTDVAIWRKVAMHRNRQRALRWSGNDTMDIDALAVATAYCDVVVTEKDAGQGLKATGLDRRYRTVLLKRLSDLPAALGSHGAQ